MTRMVWAKDLDTGIDVIDNQHKRIVAYINDLYDARTNGHKKEDIAKVIDELAGYTVSHFAFEEVMQEAAGYPLLKLHKKVHELFARRVEEYRERFKHGEDISEELNDLLVKWLFIHIKQDDAGYVESLKQNLSHDDFVERKKGFFSRLFS